MVERFDLVQYEHFDQLDRAVNGEWVLYSDYAALERQITELRAERDLAVAEREFWRIADRNSIERADAAEADNARLREALQKIASCTSYHPDDVVAIARAVLSGSGAAAPTGDAS